MKRKKSKQFKSKNKSSLKYSKNINDVVIDDLDSNLKEFIKVISISRSSKQYERFE